MASSEEGLTDDYKSAGTLRYEVKQLSKMASGKRETSPLFMIRGMPWKIMVVCNERNSGQRTLGVFVQCNAECEESWWCDAKCTLRILSHREGAPNYERKLCHVFSAKENDYGYSSFMDWSNVVDPEKGYVKDDTIVLEAEIRANAPHGVQWDSRRHTGYAGIKGTTYLTVPLQIFFFINELRKAVFQIPIENENPENSVALAVQRVFYRLQTSDGPVGTKKLIRSFGWDTFESHLQHDVHEMMEVLLDYLDSKMKETHVEGTIPRLFEGKMKFCIRCKFVPHQSIREEPFNDIVLKVKGHSNVYESLKEYIAAELLDGDKKYDAGDYGLQEAEKRITFVRFPTILRIRLNRWTFNEHLDRSIKLEDRFEFPEKLELDEFLDAPEMGQGSANYTLQSVIVHTGDFHGGWYIVYISPKADGEWCRFEDEVVSRCTKEEAIGDNYGGESLNGRSTNAYILVYIRDSMIQGVLQDVLDADIPVQLKKRLQEEKRLKHHNSQLHESTIHSQPNRQASATRRAQRRKCLIS